MPKPKPYGRIFYAKSKAYGKVFHVKSAAKQYAKGKRFYVGSNTYARINDALAVELTRVYSDKRKTLVTHDL